MYPYYLVCQDWLSRANKTTELIYRHFYKQFFHTLLILHQNEILNSVA